ncbi:MAG TPA: hypothetical protein VMX13_00690 [Sedimentisphaerales bacterium]|nr:hypothetical protein [Sedimentisphaerales bacterium]
MKYKDIIGILLAIVLASLGIIFKDSVIFAVLLLIIAAGLLCAVVFNFLGQRMPRLIHTRSDAEQLVRRVYEDASMHGGRLFATHVRPAATLPSEDIAAKYLKNIKGHLEYERFVFIEDQYRQAEWIRATFSKIDSDASIRIHSIASLPILPSALWRVLPRANLLLYNFGNKYVSLLGLDRLVTTEERFQDTNLVVVSKNKHTFQVLHRYFEAITANKPWVESDRTLSEYEAGHAHLLGQARVQSVLLRLLNLSDRELQGKVLNCGLFGGRALQFAGLVHSGSSEEHEADVDLMLITEKGSKPSVKSRITAAIGGEDGIDLVWGDDEDYFYNYRVEDRVNLDIEIFEREDPFYVEHPLLGHSIFSFYFTLYRRNREVALRDLVPLPDPYPTRKERMKVVLTDRKGIRDFIAHLERAADNTDPRRVISQLVRNLAWGVSGVRQHSDVRALETVRNEAEFAPLLPHLVEASRALRLSNDEVRGRHSAGVKCCKELLAASEALTGELIGE